MLLVSMVIVDLYYINKICEKEQDPFTKGLETTGSHTRSGRISHLMLSFYSFHFTYGIFNKYIKKVKEAQFYFNMLEIEVCVAGIFCSRQWCLECMASWLELVHVWPVQVACSERFQFHLNPPLGITRAHTLCWPLAQARGKSSLNVYFSFSHRIWAY